MHILITGGTGFIGTALQGPLTASGHSVSVLSRSQAASANNAVRVVQSLDALDAPVDAVINLAGASLAGKRWSSAYKQEIVDSRLETTRKLGEFFRTTGQYPRAWLNASAIGYYGPSDDNPLPESASPGRGFAADLCQRWEEAAAAAAGPDTRLCLLRLGVVLDAGGGAYREMAQPFRFGVANWIGDGRQWLSWIHRADVVRAIQLLLEREDLSGPFNLTAPTPVTSREFCAAMREVHRTFVTLPMPAPVMRATNC